MFDLKKLLQDGYNTVTKPKPATTDIGKVLGGISDAVNPLDKDFQRNAGNTIRNMVQNGRAGAISATRPNVSAPVQVNQPKPFVGGAVGNIAQNIGQRFNNTQQIAASKPIVGGIVGNSGKIYDKYVAPTINKVPETIASFKPDRASVNALGVNISSPGSRSFTKGATAAIAQTPQWLSGVAKMVIENNPLTNIDPGMYKRGGKTEEQYQAENRRLQEKVGIAPIVDSALNATDKVRADNAKWFANSNLQKTEADKGLAYDIGSGATSLAEAAVLTALTKSTAPAGILFGAIKSGDVYNEARDKGVAPSKAGSVAVVSGITEGALEKVGLDIFFNKFNVGSNPITNFVANSLIKATSEGLQESSQELASNAWAKVSYDKQRDLMTGVFESGFVGALLGVTGGGAASEVDIKSEVMSKAIEVGIPEAQADVISNSITAKIMKYVSERQLGNSIKVVNSDKEGNIVPDVPVTNNYTNDVDRGIANILSKGGTAKDAFDEAVSIRRDMPGNFSYKSLEDRVARIQGELSSGKVTSTLQPSGLDNRTILDKLAVENATGVEKPRGFIGSVQEAPNISQDTKSQVSSSYITKSDEQLMGEVSALLTQGGDIKWGRVENIDVKVAAAQQAAINADAQGDHEAAANLFNNLAEKGTELARGLRAFDMVDKMSPEAISIAAARTIQKYNETAVKKIPELTGLQQQQLSDAIKALDGLKNGSREKNLAIHNINEMMANMIPSTFADKALTVWKAGLLTSLRTHERNLIGNAIMLGAEVVKDAPASLADRIMAAKTGERTLTFQYKGLGEFYSQKTRQEIADLVIHGVDLSGDIAKMDVHHITWADTPIQQGLKHITDAVFRPLGAEDRAFYNAAFARSLYDQAGATAINDNRKGDVEYIKELVNNPTESMLVAATTDANYATFHDKTRLSGAANAIKRSIRSDGIITGQIQDKTTNHIAGETGKVLGEVLMPFTGVPSSIAGKTVAYSPIGLIRGAIDFGRVVSGAEIPGLQRRAAQEIGRGTVGTGLMGIGAYLMAAGLMTGQPKDKKEADLWAAQGKQANSVFVGGKWRSINSVGPQTLVLLAGAKAQEASQDGDWGKYAFGLGKDQLSQTFLAGVQGPLNAVTDPARYGQSYVGNQLSSLIPNFLKDTSKAFDPYQRENNNIGDYIKNSIPYVRNNDTILGKAGTVKRDVLGNEMKQEPTGWRAFVDLFNSKTPIDNNITKELVRLYNSGQDATPSAIGNTAMKSYGIEKMTPQELNDLEKQSGDVLRPALDKLIGSESYKQSTDEEKKKAIDGIVSEVKDSAKMAKAEGGTISSNIGEKVNLKLEKDIFDKSGKNFQEKDGLIYRKSADGTVSTMTKDKYNSLLYTSQMTSAKNKGDLNTWMTTAEKQMNSIQEQLKDPNIDPQERLTLENDADTLYTEIKKYIGYGGFTKGSGGSGGSKANTEKIIKMLETTTSDSLASQKALRNLVKNIKIQRRKA